MENKRIVSNISWSFAEKMLTDFVGTIITIVLARLLYPEDYGLVSLIQIFITISSVFVTCGFGTALIQNKNADEEQVSTIFYLNIFLGIFIYVILFISAPFIAEFKGNNQLVAIIRVLGIKVPISSVYSMLHSYVQKRMEFKRFFFSSLFGTLASGVVGVSLAYMGYGAWALVFATLTDQIMDCIMLLLSLRWFPKVRINIKSSSKMLKFGLRMLGAELIGRTYGQLRSLLIGIKYSTADLAYNLKGNKFPEMVNDLTNSIVLKVMFPVFSDIQDDNDKLLETLRQCIRISFFTLSPLLLGIALTSKKFIPILLTDKWIGCIPFVQIYCISYMLAPISSLNNKVLLATGKSKLVFYLNILEIIIDVMAITIALFVFDSPIYLALSSLVCTIIICAIYVYENMVSLHYTFSKIVQDLFKTITSLILMSILVYSVGNIIANDLLCLVLQIIIGCITYLSVSYITKNEALFYMLNVIMKLLKKRNEKTIS